MIYHIVWSEPARESYWHNIDYLLENWTEIQADNFVGEVNRILDIISKNPRAFAKTEHRNVRSALIVKQITLYYHIKDKKTIELVYFWNNHQNPKRLNDEIL